jgi:hypothetical protein
METIVYPFRRNFMHTMYILAGIMALPAGLPFLCGCFPLGWMMTAALLEGKFFVPEAGYGLVWIGMCAMCAVTFLIFPLSIFIIVLGAARQEAILTAETFTFGIHGLTRTIRLSEIVRVSIRYYHPFTFYPWGVDLVDSSGRVLFIPVARWAVFKFDNNIFDFRKMLGDILQRIPATAAVDEGVRTFIATGDFR